jgi:hypothetical protein
VICDTCNWRSAIEGEHCALGLQPDSEDRCRKHATPAEAEEEERAFEDNQLKIKCVNCN